MDTEKLKEILMMLNGFIVAPRSNQNISIVRAATRYLGANYPGPVGLYFFDSIEIEGAYYCTTTKATSAKEMRFWSDEFQCWMTSLIFASADDARGAIETAHDGHIHVDLGNRIAVIPPFNLMGLHFDYEGLRQEVFFAGAPDVIVSEKQRPYDIYSLMGKANLFETPKRGDTIH